MRQVLIVAAGTLAVVCIVAYIVWLDVTERRKQAELAEWFRQTGADAKAVYDEWHVNGRNK